jgi:hypothetical protein
MIYNVYGQTIYRQNFEGVSQFNIQLPEAAGIYFLEIKQENNRRIVKKLIKE